MIEALQTIGTVDALIVAAMFIVGGVIVAACATTVYRRFSAMSGPAHRRRR
jgi:hypothetical protein